MDIYFGPLFESQYKKFPLTLLDIGARGGMSDYWRAAEKHLRVIGVEPDLQSYAALIQTSLSTQNTYLDIGLYRESTQLDFYLTREGGDSSILKPNREFLDRFPNSSRYDIVETTQIKTDTVDRQLQQHQISDIDFIKVDTQGSELFILQGATKFLTNAVIGLEIEVEFNQMYQNQPLFADIDNFIRGFGFQLFDLRPIYWKANAGQELGGRKGQIIYADALYFKDIKSLVNLSRSLENEIQRHAKILKALSICVLYGYFDYALEILDANRGTLSDNDCKSIVALIKENIQPSSPTLPNFRGKRRIVKVLRKLLAILEPTPRGWRSFGSGEILGNLE